MTYLNDFHIAIVGGVDLFESAPKFGEVGAGVGLGPNALRALDDMGLTEAMMAYAAQKALDQKPFRFVSGLPGHEHILDYEALPEDVGLGIHRAAFLDALVELIDPAITHFSKRCTSISRNGSTQTIHFKDGTIFEADVVLGADGIKSTVRQAVTGDPEGKKRVVFTRTRACSLGGRQTSGGYDQVDRAVLMLRRHRQAHHHVSDQRWKDDHSVPAGSVEIPAHEWVMPAAGQEILDAYQDSGVQVQKLVSLIRNPRKWSMHAVDPPLSSFVKGHIALVGDAAHGMCPRLGAGVGRGFEGALVLCKLLGHSETALTNLEDVLRVYDRVRRPRANTVLERSAIAGELYESLRKGDNTAIIQSLRVQLSRQWEFVHRHDLGADLESATETLRNDGDPR